MTKFYSTATQLGILPEVAEEPAPVGAVLSRAAEVALAEVADGVVFTDAEGRVTYCNPLAAALSGNPLGLKPGAHLDNGLKLVDSEGQDLPSLLSPDSEGHIGGLADGREFIAAIPRVDELGEILLEVSVQLHKVHEGGELSGFVLVMREVSVERRISSRLSWQSSHDSLTHLPNRQYFESELQRARTVCIEGRQHHVVLYLDIYQFKVIIDTLGYAAGDQLIRQLAQELRDCLSPDDVIARVGSDEFAVLLRDCGIEQAQGMVKRLQEAVQAFVFVWDGRESHVAVSIGAVTVDRNSPPASQLLASAFDACSAAREQGRNRVKLFSDSAGVVEKRRQSTWVAEIHAALREDRLMLYRQPVVALQRNDSLHHYEVLVRMRGRDGDVIYPGVFLPAAERYGLIEEVDRWVIRRIFAYMAAEKRHGLTGHGYAINISGLSLGDETFTDFVLDSLIESGVPPSRVQFEITETSAINNLERALMFIHRLRAAGCTFALDDFGRGASSLAYLRQLPVDFLKIDGSFVRNMLGDDTDSAIVSTVNHLAKSMGISTIAEYAETPELISRLRRMGVDFAQGYGIAAASCLPPLQGDSKGA
ncbi:cyclic di-GMP phosphodiesterase PdeB [Microbulbifer aestuariivivens]|uniref:Cyclic di-GMP phosphodiesterase PdeB n=1 Tax=Microbulbifer aestuariivivens TaxID=1908308 RepID=A0ABP9WRG4_9GAMM